MKLLLRLLPACRCYSYVGRRGYSQTLSLDRQGCLYHSTVQHELLHALGFHHEQCRSDRDGHIRVLWENIQPGQYLFYQTLLLLPLEHVQKFDAVKFNNSNVEFA